MKHKRVILITQNFPYYPGEWFLEEEVNYWASIKDLDLTVMPLNANGIPREVPSNITIDTFLCKKANLLTRFFLVLRSFLSSIFWKEVLHIYTKFGINNIECYRMAFSEVYHTYHIYGYLRRYLYKERDAVIYTYWFNAATYAAILGKRRGIVRYVVSRAHGCDLYEYRTKKGYLPLKRQLGGDVSRFFMICDEAKEYLAETFRIPRNNINVSRLGVKVEDRESIIFNNSETLSIVSVARCETVKRIDKIIDAISLFALQNPGLRINWNHIGAGSELLNLKKRAKERFKDLSVLCQFLGEYTNAEVRSFLRENIIDVFINLSDFEGVPVSIMEAMSYGIPAIAPNIGGISELVNAENGVLLSAKPDLFEAVQGLSSIEHLRKIATRLNAKNTITKLYNSDKNYNILIESISSL